MTMFKKAMSYLGLGPEDPYDDYDLPEEPERPVRGRPAYAPEPEPSVRAMPRAAVREQPPASFPRSADFEAPAPVRVQRPAGSSSSTVRTVPASAGTPRPHTVRPRRFDQAQEVADRFKEGQPVIVNLQDVERDLERRLIDFCSGLCYGLDGKMEKVANGVYLLTPANASVSPEDRRLIGELDE